MIIKSLKLDKRFLMNLGIVFTLILTSLICQRKFSPQVKQVISSNLVWDNKDRDTMKENENDYIKWVDFTPTYEALSKTSKLDIESHNNGSEITYNWIQLLACLACKYGGNFKKFNDADLNSLTDKIKSGTSIEELTKDLKYYSYYYEAYDAVLHDFIGEYEIEVTNSETNEKTFEKKYGLKAFCPIAANYNFSHYDDFGASRSYGYKRSHLGNDLMGSVGTPIVAVESGVIEAVGWNQYGGWRIGIRSFDGKRYYYYAHLRKNHPYSQELKEGQTINAGDVIGYLGMTGYSTTENVNNINIPHLHFGLQLIFDESQKDGTNQIWIDVYQIIEFLKKNSSQVYKDSKSGEFYRKNQWHDLSSDSSFMP